MSELPESWLEVELHELTSVNYGKSLAAGNRATAGHIPVVGSSGTVGHHNEALVNGPCLVVGRKGAAGAVHLVRESSWPIDTAYFVQPPESLDLIYLSQVLGTRQLGTLDKSTAIPSLSRDDLYRVRIPVAPAAEQTRIVAKLEELLSDLDAGVAELKAAQKKLAQYRQSLLKAAVTGELTSKWRAARALSESDEAENGQQLLQRILTERRARWEAKQLAKFKAQGKTPPKDWQKKYPEPVKPDTCGLPELPEGWVWATIDQLAIDQRYGSSAKTNEDATGVPVLRMGNIQAGQLDLSNLKYLPCQHDEFPALYLRDGDLLFNRTNSPELVGKSAIYRLERTPCSYASYLIAVTFNDAFLPEIASSYINSAFGRAWVKSVVVQQVGQANVNGSKLAALAVPMPPLSEQYEIVDFLTRQIHAAFEQEQMIERSLKQSTAQRQNILRAAFAGQLVPQDPADEPASVLLARIRAERAQHEAVKKPRGRKPKHAA